MSFVIDNYNFFLFDLDDTIYPEIDYLDEAYKKIAKYLEKETEIESTKIYNFLINEFRKNGRSNLFNKMFKSFNIDFHYLDDMLNIMRTLTVSKKFFLKKNIYHLLSKIISKSQNIFVVTNGNVIQQKNKVRNIDWKNLDDHIVFIYANEFQSKPSTKSFDFIKQKYSLNEDLTIMIGDSFVDKEYANNCKIDFQFIEKLIKQDI